MKLPPLDDPSWKKFAERHERFMERHPNFEAHAEEQFRFFTERREQNLNIGAEANDSTNSGKQWIYVSKRHRIADTSESYSVETAFGEITGVTLWTKSSAYPQAKGVLIFTWHSRITYPYELLLALISPKTLLSLAAPISLGLVSVNGARELSPDILSDPAQPVAFRLILSNELSQQALPPLAHGSSAGEDREHPRHSEATTAESRHRLTERRGVELRRTRTPSSKSSRPARLIQKAAGVADDFPSEQPLPADWFPGEEVTLHFSAETGPWRVRRSGTLDELVLQFWSVDEQPIGEPLEVGRYSKEVPVKSPSELSRIDISKKHESQVT